MLIECPVKILATDVSPAAVEVTAQNLASAGVAGAVTLQRRLDVLQAVLSSEVKTP